MVKAWELSPSHKRGMEDKYMTRGFNAVYVYKSPFYDGEYVALSVYQSNWSEISCSSKPS